MNRININKLNEAVDRAFDRVLREEFGRAPMDTVQMALERTNIAMRALDEYIGSDKSRVYDLANVKNQLNGIKRNLEIFIRANGNGLGVQ